MNLLNRLINIISLLGYPGILLVVGLEYACFPMPSEVLLPFLGMTAAQSGFTFLGVLFYSVLGGIIGSVICYLIGYYGGYPIITRIQNRFPKSRKSITTLEQWFQKYGKSAVLFARIVPLTRTYISFLAGAVRLNIITFTLFSLVGIVVWNTVLISLGYFIGNNMDVIQGYFKQYSIFILFVCFILLCVYMFRKDKKK